MRRAGFLGIVAGAVVVMGAAPVLADVPIIDCNADYEKPLRDAIGNAQGMALTARHYLEQFADKNPSPYETYFGPIADTARRDKVKNNTIAIEQALNRDFIVTCKDEAMKCAIDTNPYAYVSHTDQQHRIFICWDSFKTITAYGYNSQAGVFVHEMSHFDDVAGTRDLRPCNTNFDCTSLGSSMPDTAAQNSDTYQYFFESSTVRRSPLNGRLGTLVCVAIAILLLRRRHRRLHHLAVAAICTAGSLAAGCAAGHAQARRAISDSDEPRLRCTLSTPETIRSGEPVPLTFTLSNVSSRPMHVLRWGTPFEEDNSRYMTLRRNGVEVKYQGFIVDGKARPKPEHYVRIEPGQAASGTIDLARTFSVKEPGQYEAEFWNRLQDAYGDPSEKGKDGLRWVTLACNRARFRVIELQ